MNQGSRDNDSIVNIEVQWQAANHKIIEGVCPGLLRIHEVNDIRDIYGDSLSGIQKCDLCQDHCRDNDFRFFIFEDGFRRRAETRVRAQKPYNGVGIGDVQHSEIIFIGWQTIKRCVYFFLRNRSKVAMDPV